MAVPHLVTADDAIISFGQGCEGEPTLMGDLLVQGVEAVRARTAAGLININTNGSRPHVIRALARAGLNSIRVSLISPLPEIFNAYVRPWGYSLQAVSYTHLDVYKRQGVRSEKSPRSGPGSAAASGGREDEAVWLRRKTAGQEQRLVLD